MVRCDNGLRYTRIRTNVVIPRPFPSDLWLDFLKECEHRQLLGFVGTLLSLGQVEAADLLQYVDALEDIREAVVEGCRSQPNDGGHPEVTQDSPALELLVRDMRLCSQVDAELGPPLARIVGGEDVERARRVADVVAGSQLLRQQELQVPREQKLLPQSVGLLDFLEHLQCRHDWTH